MEKLSWSAPEYEEKERGNDWFWALGVIIVAGSAASIIYGNYFFAALLIIGGLLLRFFAIKKPDIIFYELGDKGLRMQNQLYLYENIKSFHIETEGYPTLFIKSERFFMPIISVPIDLSMVDEIHDIMLGKNIEEEKMQEHSSVKIMDSLGF